MIRVQRMSYLFFSLLHFLAIAAVHTLSEEDVITEFKAMRRIIEHQNEVIRNLKIESERQEQMNRKQDLKIRSLVKSVGKRDVNVRNLNVQLIKRQKQHELESEVNEMRLTIKDMEREIKMLKLSSVAGEFIQGNKNKTSFNRPLQSNSAKDPQHERHVIRKGRGILKSSVVGTVAFYAYMSTDMTNVGGHQTLIYDIASLNVGSAYHPISGVFIAPTNGIYVFTWSARVSGGSHFSLELTRNGYAVGSIYVHSTDPSSNTAGTTAVIQIVQGDEIFIRTRIDFNNGTIDSNEYGYASFAGWKLN